MMVRMVSCQPEYSASASSTRPSASQDFARRLLRAADADPVEGPPGRDVVLHDAAVRSHPDAGDLGHIEMRDALGRHQPAPGDIAGVARQLLAEHLSAHRRMDAVGADEDVAGRGAAVGERDGDAVGILIEALDARAEAEAFLAEHRRAARRAGRRGARCSTARRNAPPPACRAACSRAGRRCPRRDSRALPDSRRRAPAHRRGRASAGCAWRCS